MAYPNVEPGFETFFEPTRIWLFGKEFKSLTYERGSMGHPRGPDKAGEFTDLRAAAVPNDAGLLDQLRMPPRRVERALRRQSYQYNKDAQGNEVIEVNPPIFARIYSFSFEGHYYKTAAAALVSGFWSQARRWPDGGACAGSYRFKPSEHCEIGNRRNHLSNQVRRH
jgi:hypothetical protein